MRVAPEDAVLTVQRLAQLTKRKQNATHLTLIELQSRGLAAYDGNDRWRITDEGRERA